MKIYHDFQLSRILWYKIGGKARYLLEVQNKEDIFKALDFVEKNHIKKLFVIGLGSNLLFSDDYFDGAVIRIVDDNLRFYSSSEARRSSSAYSSNGAQAKLRSKHALSSSNVFSTGSNNKIHLTKDGYVEAFAGETLDNLIQFSFDNHLIGLEWAGGLPGTVGAGVRGNVGAFGGEIKDTLFAAEILELRKKGFEVITINHSDMNFSYRNSIVKQNKNMIVISGTFILSETDKKQVVEAREVYQSNIKYRQDRHPLEYPNCGSVFKNIVKKEEVEKILSVWPDINEKSTSDWHGKVAMGYVIKRLGFSGFQKGVAQVSEKHANFVVNLGGAKFKDVITIIEAIKQKFLDTFGFSPEIEVEIVHQ